MVATHLRKRGSFGVWDDGRLGGRSQIDDDELRGLANYLAAAVVAQLVPADAAARELAEWAGQDRVTLLRAARRSDTTNGAPDVGSRLLARAALLLRERE
jgi:hypothetical protein